MSAQPAGFDDCSTAAQLSQQAPRASCLLTHRLVTRMRMYCSRPSSTTVERHALKLRRLQERLRVMQKLVELQRTWEGELESVQDYVCSRFFAT